MPTKEIESIHKVVSSTLCFHTKYAVTMRTVFRFACELFILWQVVMYGVLNVQLFPSAIIGIIGLVLLACTAITLRIYNNNARELKDHSSIISDIESRPRPEQAENVYQFACVLDKYKVGRKLVFIMNTTSVCYIIIFAIATLLYQILS